jgi:predicted phage terminase large subunit-like protein
LKESLGKMSELSLKDFDILSDQDKAEAVALLNRYNQLEKQEDCQADFLSFVKSQWPDFVEGRHHKIIADKFNKIAEGKLKRLIVCLPPRHTKSEFASTYFPAWMMGLRGNLKIIQTTHTAELAVRFGRRVRNIIDSSDYQQVFPKLKLQADNKSAGRWTSSQGGEFFAAGVGGAITGRGADLLLIDDPVSEQDALSPTAMDSIYDWYTSGPRQRLQPGGIVVIVMTRWSTKDLVGQVLKKQGDDYADKWELVEFPAIMPESQEPLWPEYWSKEELLSVKASLPVPKWNAQWMQNPTSEEGSIVKREWWNVWEGDVPPYSYVIQSYDTAFSKKESADYSAVTTWAVFTPIQDGPEEIILLDAKRVRLDFPDLKKLAWEEWKYWEPDCVLIEAKASGTPLTQELRRMGIPVTAYTPSRGQDKIARMNSVAPIFESGMVWVPETEFAEEVIEEMASFPFGDNDDYCDSSTMALMRFRQGGFVALEDDYQDAMEPLRRDRRVYY